MDCYCLDQPMELLIKTNVDGSKVIKKLSRNETKQMENFKKMSKAEKKMFSVKDVPVPYYVPKLGTCFIVPNFSLYFKNFQEFSRSFKYFL